MNEQSHRMAKEIRVEQTNLGAPQVYIDGELFPFFTVAEPKVVKLGKNQLPTLVIEVVAERLVVNADTRPTDG